MSKEKLEVIKEADLTNNCPECFNQELKLTFYQKHKYSRLFHRTTGEVSNAITCKKCSSTIYPVNWTQDIERVFDYYQKMAHPEKKSLKFKPLFYALVLLLIALVASSAYLYLEGVIQF
ncbi:hypothetical protein [Spongiimicrobium sp. 3-5]|uniref:hypothetical protein n=1 Tax=Spongiimicrobium sp. 3-5 TaxID=3332596 RepID=UPI00397F5416